MTNDNTENNKELKDTFLKDQVEAASEHAENLISEVEFTMDATGDLGFSQRLDSIEGTYIGEKVAWLFNQEAQDRDRSKLRGCEHVDAATPSVKFIHLLRPHGVVCGACMQDFATVVTEKFPGVCDYCETDGHVNFYETLVQYGSMMIVGNLCTACGDKSQDDGVEIPE
jgi:hypothetical protein